MIDSGEHVGHRRCDDHSHPVFRITLKEAEGDQAKVLSALLAAVPQPRPGAGRLRGAGRRRGVPPRGGGFMARRRRPFGSLGGGFGEVNGLSCEEICEAVYAACFEATEGMPFDEWVALCALEYDLCMAGCDIFS
jgi:hypothetical protein